jgi:hypothetical protein
MEYRKEINLIMGDAIEEVLAQWEREASFEDWIDSMLDMDEGRVASDTMSLRMVLCPW